MEYRDNYVSIDFLRENKTYTLVSGTYKLDSVCVSKGQDPNNNLKAGMTFSFGEDGKFNVKVGRHKTEEVANWWKSRIKSYKNTFDKDPDKLNFAMIGTLELVVKSSDKTRNITYEKVAIAQGNNGLRNNWWFGSPLGYRTVGKGRDESSEQISLYGTDNESNRFLTVVTKADAGSSVNSIKWNIVRKIQTDNADWMIKCFNDRKSSVKLCDMVLPGSHDSGMSELHHIHKFASEYHEAILTQSASVYEQLLYGCRYFDLRIDYDHNNLVTYHWVGGKFDLADVGANGQSLRDIFEQAKRFLNEYPKETFIFKFSHIRECFGHTKESTTNKLDECLLELKNDDLLYCTETDNVYLHNVTYDKLMKKIIVACDYRNGSPKEGVYDYDNASKATALKKKNKLIVYDNYSNTSDFSKMKEDQTKKWKEYSDAHNEKNQERYPLFLLSWTLTLDITHLDIKALAKTANNNLQNELKLIDKGYLKPNVVYLDFIDYKTSNMIIMLNK